MLSSVFKWPNCARAYATRTGGSFAAKVGGALAAAGHPPDYDPIGRWLIFTIILPFLGVFVYLIARGHKMADRDAADAKAQDEAARAYIREAANGNGTADDLAKLADLRDRGVISEADFQQGKDKILRTAA